MGYDDRMGGPSRGRGGGGSRHNPYGRGGGGGRGDYEEEVIEISTNRLYVHNLSWRVSWQDLKDHFRQAGDVIHAKIMTEGPGGRSKGCGIVEMDTVDSAANAIDGMLAPASAAATAPNCERRVHMTFFASSAALSSAMAARRSRGRRSALTSPEFRPEPAIA